MVSTMLGNATIRLTMQSYRMSCCGLNTRGNWSVLLAQSGEGTECLIDCGAPGAASACVALKCCPTNTTACACFLEKNATGLLVGQVLSFQELVEILCHLFSSCAGNARGRQSSCQACHTIIPDFLQLELGLEFMYQYMMFFVWHLQIILGIFLSRKLLRPVIRKGN